MDQPARINRRSFLRAGALTTGAVGGALLLGDAQDAVGAPRAFDVNATPRVLFRAAKLSNPHESWQSIAYDRRHRRLFYAVPPHDPTKKPGQIRVSYLHPDGRPAPVGEHMDFYGFGNGHGLGIDYVGSETFIWMMAQDNHTLCRFRWAGHGGPYHYALRHTHPAPGFAEYDLVPTSYEVSCASDVSSNRILVRHYPHGATSAVYEVFTLADIRARKYSRVRGTRTVPEDSIFAGIHEPPYEPRLHGKRYPNYQGMVLYGNYGYVLTGRQWSTSPNQPSCAPVPGHPGDVHLTRFDVRSGKAVHSRVITADSGMDNREPEGVAVVSTAHGPKLVFGLLNVLHCHPNTDRRMDALAIG